MHQSGQGGNPTIQGPEVEVVILGQWSDYKKSEDKFMLMHFSVAIFSDIVEDADHGADADEREDSQKVGMIAWTNL